MKLLYTLLISIASLTLHAQTLEDWTWYTPEICDQAIRNIQKDSEGNVWMTCKEHILKFDGNTYSRINVEESGIEVPAPGYHSLLIDVSIDGVIWMTDRNQVLKFEMESEEWTIFEPLLEGVNFQFHHLEAVSENEIWLSSISGLWEYNGVEWIHRKFYKPDLNMKVNSPREIVVDNENNKWVTTSSSICIEGGCYYPSGVIRISESDTLFFDGETLGFPSAWISYIDLDSDDNLVLAIREFSTNDVYYMKYINEEWTQAQNVPFEGRMRNMKVGSADQIYFLYEGFIPVLENGIWDVYQIDTSQIHEYYNFLLDKNDGIYVSGYKNLIYPQDQGVFGYLPNLNFKARGAIYSDLNSNGILDAGDKGIKNHFIQTTNEDRVSFSNLKGDFSMAFSEEGDYDIEALLPMYHTYGVPDDGMHSVSLSIDEPFSNGNDFGFEPDLAVVDLSVTMTALNNANPGFQNCYEITIMNNAPTIIDATVEATFDDLLDFNYSSITPTSNSNGKISFEVSQLEWLETRNIRVCFDLPPEPELIGTVMKHSVLLDPTMGSDIFPQNNYVEFCHEITGPYDPNAIEVMPEGEGEIGGIPLSTESLEYTIHFQNVGNDTARNVKIHNPIDENLDLRSLHIIGSSHEFTLNYDNEEGILIWLFDGINLPDSTANRIESNGFVKYTIDLADKEVGREYRNIANIFFDFNLPITTNETLNTIVPVTNTKENSNAKKPCMYNVNRIGDRIHIDFPEIKQYNIRILDVSGKLLNRTLVHHNEFVIDASNLPDGVKVIYVESEGCLGKSVMVY